MEYYKQPKGYRPDKRSLRNGMFIADMQKGTKFIASDGSIFIVTRPVRTTPCAGGVAEQDMWARRLGTDMEVLFHCPVGANPLRCTYVIC